MILAASILDWLARRPAAASLLIGLVPVILALAVMPWVGIPQPRIQDEFSYLLAADTFASGRLTNPPHPHWRFFEALHVIQQPTYASKYPPGQGLAMALGQVLFGHPWFGVVMSFGAMCAATHWMLRGWLPPRWALLGALLLLAKYPVFHYWMQSYWGGAVAAIGGSILLGALPRLQRGGGPVTGLAGAAGLFLLLITRPFEGMAFATPVVLAPHRYAKRTAISAVMSLAVAACGLAYYNFRVTGDPLLLPYFLHERDYTSVPTFYPQEPLTPRRLDNEAMRRANEILAGGYGKLLTFRGFALKTYLATELPRRGDDPSYLVRSLFSVLLFASIPFVYRDPAMRVPLRCLAFTAAALVVVIFYREHYAAPIAGLKILLITQALRHAVAWQRVRWLRPAIAWGCLAFILAMAPVYAWVRGTGIRRDTGFVVERSQVIAGLTQATGRHLVFVRYGATHDISQEWVRNRANIDESAIVWARDLGADANRVLIRYFPDRRAWLLEADQSPARAVPYPGT